MSGDSSIKGIKKFPKSLFAISIVYITIFEKSIRFEVTNFHFLFWDIISHIYSDHREPGSTNNKEKKEEIMCIVIIYTNFIAMASFSSNTNKYINT